MKRVKNLLMMIDFIGEPDTVILVMMIGMVSVVCSMMRIHFIIGSKIMI